MVKRITTKKELLELKKTLGVRDDWCGPDKQKVYVVTRGYSFDNTDSKYEHEVRIYKNRKLVTTVNLAALFAFATGYEEKETHK